MPPPGHVERRFSARRFRLSLNEALKQVKPKVEPGWGLRRLLAIFVLERSSGFRCPLGFSSRVGLFLSSAAGIRQLLLQLLALECFPLPCCLGLSELPVDLGVGLYPSLACAPCRVRGALD